MSTPTLATDFTPLDDIDPGTPGDPFTRLRYNYGQLLGAEDFTTEQRYFLLRSRLHNAALHGYGTVWGLRVGQQESETAVQLTCEPGLAIDPLGREIYVPQKVCLDITGLADSRFWADLAPPQESADDETKRRVYVVLRYRACLSEPVPAIAPPCTDATDGLSASRVLDSYRLCLEASMPDLTELPVRDITDSAPGPARERLLEHILTLGNPPSRLWSGGDDAPLLLAVLDLQPVGDPVERVEFSGKVDNSVRALLPSVQGAADLALAIHLESNVPPAAFQAVGVASRAGTGADAGHTLIHVDTTKPVLPDSVGNGSVRVLRFDAAAKTWVEAPLAAVDLHFGMLDVTVGENWADDTAFQVCLAGTGASALLDTDHRPLAGVAGEAMPPGSGRDASLFASHPTTP